MDSEIHDDGDDDDDDHYQKAAQISGSDTYVAFYTIHGSG